MKKALFLYSELADYSISCFKALADAGVDVHVVHWPVNPEAPFKFSAPNGITFYKKESYHTAALTDLINTLQPDLIYSSGWIDKDYLAALKNTSGGVRVLGLDNKWEGTLRQYAGALFARITLSKHFHFAFVAGSSQRKFARKIGFANDRIQQGLYVADTAKFQKVFETTFAVKRKQMPRRFLYVGRYVTFKGIFDLWDAFLELKEENPTNTWELWSVGTGDQFHNKRLDPSIKHFGFLQPAEFGRVVEGSAVYVLPSHREPWAVSVQEMAVSGMPLLCSDQVGAAEKFLVEGQNGFTFRAGNKAELKAKLRMMCDKSDTELIEMGLRSNQLGLEHSPANWAEQIINMMHLKTA